MTGFIEASLMCMATALFFEARGEPLAGKLAVAAVVLNRVEDRRFPNTICGVIKQGPQYKWGSRLPLRHRCQFSFYCDGKSDKLPKTKAAEEAKRVARMVLTQPFTDITGGATFYHAAYVSPEWAASKKKTVRINNHIFYRWKK